MHAYHVIICLFDPKDRLNTPILWEKTYVADFPDTARQAALVAYITSSDEPIKDVRRLRFWVNEFKL